MKLFKDQNGAIYAYEEDGSQDAFILPELIPISEQEAEELRRPTAAQVKSDRIAAIDAELAFIDAKRARALSDAVLTGDKTRAQALEDQAAPLRAERLDLTT